MVPASVTLFGDATHDVEKTNSAKITDNVDRVIKFFIIILPFNKGIIKSTNGTLNRIKYRAKSMRIIERSL
jgi:hypothetical protein